MSVVRWRGGLALLALLARCATADAPPVVLGFEDVAVTAPAAGWAAPLPARYGGLEWHGGTPAVANADASALLFPLVPGSGSQCLYSGAYPADLEVAPQRGRFDFLGARFRTWGGVDTGTVSFSGWIDGEKAKQAGPFVIDRSFRPIHLEWHGLHRLTIQSSHGYLMDDFRYRPAPAEGSHPQDP